MPFRFLPARVEVLRTYRHLLREATYLPLVARPFITNHIKKLFRRHRSTDKPEKYLQSAQHGQRYLRAATTGSLLRLRTILLHVFGRTGRRRRELMSRFVALEPAADSDALQEQIRSVTTRVGAKGPRKPDWFDKWDLEKVMALVRSQSRQKLPNTPIPPIEPRQVNLGNYVPKENIWGRPLSQEARRRKMMKAWKKMIPRVLPPISQGEWELLRDLASGKRPAQEWQLPRRRTPVAATPARKLQKDRHVWRWEEYASKPTYRVERGRSRRLRPMSGLEDDTSPNPSGPIDHHNYSPKALTRLYGEIWAMTATVEKKADGRGWNITWGGTEKRIATAMSLEFFEGAPIIPTRAGKRCEGAKQQAAS